MENAPKTPWYQDGRYIAGIGLAALLISAVASGGPEPTSPVQPTVAGTSNFQQIAPPLTQFVEVQPEVKVQPKPQAKTVPLSNDNYYTNSAGNEVHSPAYAPSQPAGASAQCRDGTYSFSQNRRGTCSHHGGVARWF